MTALATFAFATIVDNGTSSWTTFEVTPSLPGDRAQNGQVSLNPMLCGLREELWPSLVGRGGKLILPAG